MHETPVARSMLCCEFRSINSFATCVLGYFGHRRWHELGLVTARSALVFGLPALRTVASDMHTATASTQTLRKPSAKTQFYSLVDHK